jgi:hypothetical protein
MIRNQIDDSNFFVSFMVRPSDKIVKALKEAEEEEALYNSRLRENFSVNVEEINSKLSKIEYDTKGVFTVTCSERNIFQFNKKEGGINTIQFFRAKSVLYFLITKSNKNNLNKYA